MNDLIKSYEAIKNNFLGLNKVECENLKLTFCNAPIMKVETILNKCILLEENESNLLLESKKRRVEAYKLVIKNEEISDKLCLNHCLIEEDFFLSFRKAFKDEFTHALSTLDDSKLNNLLIVYEGKLPAIRSKESNVKDFYTLHLDKELLNFIYEYKDKIDYIFYKYRDRYEIIDVNKIPSLIEEVIDAQEWELDREIVPESKLYRDI